MGYPRGKVFSGLESAPDARGRDGLHAFLRIGWAAERSGYMSGFAGRGWFRPAVSGSSIYQRRSIALMPPRSIAKLPVLDTRH
ncbi:hypothetical protein NL676_031366 [Syzygium grande]|nr:hypothetical protein NL676_031366 [Syzygium grande]